MHASKRGRSRAERRDQVLEWLNGSTEAAPTPFPPCRSSKAKNIFGVSEVGNKRARLLTLEVGHPESHGRRSHLVAPDSYSHCPFSSLQQESLAPVCSVCLYV